MGFQWWQLLLIGLLVVLLFGRGKISGIMGDVAEGIKSFKKGMREDETPVKEEPVKSLSQESSPPSDVKKETKTEA